MAKLNILNPEDRINASYEGSPQVTLSDGNTYTYHPYGKTGPSILGHELGHSRQAESDEAWLQDCRPDVYLYKLRESFKQQVNDARKQTKAKFVTEGKDAEYILKRQEALSILSDPAASALNYPLAAERAARKGTDLNAVAGEWKALSDSLVNTLLPTLEGVYESAIEQLNTATTKEEMKAIVADAKAGFDLIG